MTSIRTLVSRVSAVRSSLLVLLAGPGAGRAEAVVEIQWWHAMDGALGGWVKDLAEGFNKSQKEYQVNAVYKGNYTEVMTGAIAAFRAKQQPAHRAGVRGRHGDDDGREGRRQAGVRADGGRRREVRPEGVPAGGHRLLHDGGRPDALAPAQQLHAGPVLQQGRLQEGGARSEQAPRDLAGDGRVREEAPGGGLPRAASAVNGNSGFCWRITRHGTTSLFASKQNGFAGFDTELLFNTPLHVRIIDQLAQWQKTKTFDYGGRKGDAQPEVRDGGMRHVSGFIGALRERRQGRKGQVGVRHWHDAVLAGRKGRAAELDHRRRHAVGDEGPQGRGIQGRGAVPQLPVLPEVQAASHQSTGYLPITLAAYEPTHKEGFYAKVPGTDTIRQITNKPPTANSKGLRLGNFVQIRDVIEEELEAALSGKKTAKEGMDAAVKRGNELLRQFEADEPVVVARAGWVTRRPRVSPRVGSVAVHKRVVFREPGPPLFIGDASARHHRRLLYLAGGAGPLPVAAP